MKTEELAQLAKHAAAAIEGLRRAQTIIAQERRSGASLEGQLQMIELLVQPHLLMEDYAEGVQAIAFARAYFSGERLKHNKAARRRHERKKEARGHDNQD